MMAGTGKAGLRCRWAAAQLRSGLVWQRWWCLGYGLDHASDFAHNPEKPNWRLLNAEKAAYRQAPRR